MSALEAGKLDRRVTLCVKSQTRNSFGEAETVIVALASVWAEKRVVSASETFRADRDLARETAIFRIRWRDGVTPSMVLVEDGIHFDIDGVSEIGKRQGLELIASRKIG